VSEATHAPPAGAPPTPYNAAFYTQQANESLLSARAVVPLVMDLVKPAAVLDVGCGVGTWLRAFAENGVTDYLGLDGDYVNRADLRIPADRFRPTDLVHPPDLGRTFELAVCLEVAEHLPEAVAPELVGLLTRAAPVVLFSAAPPGQRGTNHITERWSAFWRARFAGRGFVRLDPFRPRIWRDRRVNWWYQQNLFLYVRAAELGTRPALQAEYELAKEFPFELLHEQVFAPLIQPPGLGATLRALPGAAWRTLRRIF
jgi:SAM-dependent methyltransferase